MCQYIYAYNVVETDEGNFLQIPKFDYIISEVTPDMTDSEIAARAEDRILTALQMTVQDGDEIPEADPDTLAARGFVSIDVTPAMKLQLYKLVRENDTSIPRLAERLAKRIGKSLTVAHRLLNLRYNSGNAEIKAACAAYGKRLRHEWSFETCTTETKKAA